MLKLIKRMLPVLVCAVIFVMSGALGAECSAEEDYGYFGALEDHQDALSGEQAQELLDLLDSTAREIHANVGVILGNASLDGLSERSYAKEFHNRCFGEYSDSIVLMLVQAGSGKVDQIYCTDRAYDMYQPRIDSIFDAVYDGLDSSGGHELLRVPAVARFRPVEGGHQHRARRRRDRRADNRGMRGEFPGGKVQKARPGVRAKIHGRQPDAVHTARRRIRARIHDVPPDKQQLLRRKPPQRRRRSPQRRRRRKAQIKQSTPACP